MTAIMALKEGNKIYIGADGRASAENIAINCLDSEDKYKLRRVNGSPNCVIAFSGEERQSRVIMGIDNLLDGKNDPSYNYIVKNTLPKIYSALEEKGMVTHKEDRCDFGCGMILSTKTHLYSISQIGIVTEQSKVAFAGVGFLSSYATYLSLRNKHLPPPQLIKRCIEESIRRCDYVGYPIIIMENNAKAETIVINED